MKPTPSKVVLLMSAAGLGLSWSGVALASRDNNASASSALTFGVARRGEPGCGTAAPDGWASCSPAHGELVRTIVAETAALPLPLPDMAQASEANGSFRGLEAYAAASARRPVEARAADDVPEPDDKAPPPETPATARVVDAAGRDREADAIAIILLDDPRGIADDAAMDSEPVALPAVAPMVVADSSLEARQQAGDQKRSAPTTSTAESSAPLAGGRGAGDAHTAADAGPAAADSEAVGLVLASLAEVLGAHASQSPSGLEANDERAVVARHEESILSSAVSVNAEPGQRAAVPIETSRSDDASLQRSSQAEDIVVAPSHSDKILMTLAALRAGEGAEPGRLGAQTKKTVVVRHTDKVLETLALFQSSTPKRAAWACTSASDEETIAASAVRVEARPAAPALQQPVEEAVVAGIGRELDIPLDLLPPVAEQPLTPAVPEPAPVLPARARVPSAIGSELVALSADKLDEVRGGFVTDGGLKISFGIERAVYLNGNLVTTTSLNIADLSRISGGQAQVTGNGTPGSLALLQSGTGNVFAPCSISSTAAGTVIQNTLDNQKINTITRIDAVVNSSGIMRSINLQSSMQSAIVNSLRR